jgi:23S rRNA pseudouridine2605 synthase
MPAKKPTRRPSNRPDAGPPAGPSRSAKGGRRRADEASRSASARPGSARPGSARGNSQRISAGRSRAQRDESAGDDSPATESGSQRIRLQRALAAAGFGSRRQCEELILEGRVEVDGSIADQLGCTIDPSTSKIYVDGTPLKSRRLVYYIVNKPTGVVTTNADPEGRPRVIDLVPPDERVFPVGRLDRSSEGLILLTNDGELAQRLAHPKYEVQKVYRVTVAGNVQTETLRQMHQGIYIAEGLVKVEGARILKARSRATEMEITLKEGKNREIRRILARLGHKVQTLKRIAIGTLKLGEMPTGAYRRLTVEEIRKLKSSVQATAAAGAEPDDSPVEPRKSPRPAKRRSDSQRPDSQRPDGKRPDARAGARTDGSPRPDSGGKRPLRSPLAKEGAKAKGASRSKADPEPLIQLPGIPRRRSGVVIGAESPSEVTAPKIALPIELENELPGQPRRGRRDRSSRFSELDDEEFETLVESDGPPRGKRGAKLGGKPGAKLGGRPAANPRVKKAGKTIAPPKSSGGIKSSRSDFVRGDSSRGDKPRSSDARTGQAARGKTGARPGKKRPPGGRGKKGV